jgi:hypothetical protein
VFQFDVRRPRCEIPVGDGEAKGVVERLQRFMGTSFAPGRSFISERDYQDQLDRWFSERANCASTARCGSGRSTGSRGSGADAALPALAPGLDRRLVLRVLPKPYVPVDRNDYSLDPRFAGRRAELSVTQREVTGVALDTGELVCPTEGALRAG